MADDVAERLKKRRGSGWTKEQVRSLSSEAILARLAGFGVGTSTSQFVQLARVEQSADVVAQDWRRRFEVSARGSDDNFIEIAACVLWERLLPERPSFEVLDERMQAGYTALRANDFVRAFDNLEPAHLSKWAGIQMTAFRREQRDRLVQTTDTSGRERIEAVQ